MRRLLLLAVLAVALGVAASAAGDARGGAQVVSSSRLIEGGNLRITATIVAPAQIGKALQVTFRVENVSKQPRKIQIDYATSLWLVVRSSDGVTYDTRRAYTLTGSLGGPMRLPTRLRPGATVTRTFPDLRVQWSGPLRITPGWDRTPLPPLRVAVTSPGRVRSRHEAVAAAVAATGHLLDRCRPAVSGKPVTGRIDAPRNSSPPLRARCSVTLRRERGFDLAQVLIATPVGYRGVHLVEPYERLTWPKRGPNAEMIAWLFVVTRAGATSIDSTSMESTRPASRMAPDWQWSTSGWQGGPGGSHCGGIGGGGGGYNGPLVEFVSVCAR